MHDAPLNPSKTMHKVRTKRSRNTLILLALSHLDKVHKACSQVFDIIAQSYALSLPSLYRERGRSEATTSLSTWNASGSPTPGGAKIARPEGPEGPRPFSSGKKFLPFDISSGCPNEGKTRVSAGFPMIGGNISPKAEFQTGLLFAANRLERPELSLVRVDCLIFQGGRG